MTYALKDAGVAEDLSGELGIDGIRLFELERTTAENSQPGRPPRVYLLFREIDGSNVVDISRILQSRGINASSMMLIDVKDGSITKVKPNALKLNPTPMVLAARYANSPRPDIKANGSELGYQTLSPEFYDKNSINF